MNEAIKIPLWRKGDWDASIGVFFDSFVKILVGVAVLAGVMHMPNDILFGQLIPAIGLGDLIWTGFLVYMARQLAKKTNNPDVTALPGGLGAGRFFVYLFAVMLPAYFASGGDFMHAWKAGIGANIIGGLIFIICGFLTPYILKYIPKGALFGALAGGALTWLVLSPVADGFVKFVVLLPTMVTAFVFYFGNVQSRFPTAILIVGIGSVIAWSTGNMEVAAVRNSLDEVGFFLPFFQLALLGECFQAALPFLAVIVTFTFGDVVASIQALEQAEASGESYSPRHMIMGVGVINIINSLFGNPFAIALYWGHPGWKKVGATTSYPLMTGVFHLFLCITGLSALLVSIIPVEATYPLLIFIALLSTAQAFEVSPKRHYPALGLALCFPIYELINQKIVNATKAGKNALIDFMNTQGVNTGDIDIYSVQVSADIFTNAGVSPAYATIASGAMFSAVLLGTITCYIIDNQWRAVGVSVLAGAFLAAIGLIHAQSVGFMENPTIVATYLVMGLVFLGYSITENSTNKSTTYEEK